jgi:hypothetical protein
MMRFGTMIGKSVLVGLAGLVGALLLLSVTSLAGYLVLAIVLGSGVLLFGGCGSPGLVGR